MHQAPSQQPTGGRRQTTSSSFSNYLSPNQQTPLPTERYATIRCSDISSTLQLSPGSRRMVVVLLRVRMKAKCSFHDIPQYGHDRNDRHDPQVEPCTLDGELDERGEEDRKGRYPFHDAGPCSRDPSYGNRNVF